MAHDTHLKYSRAKCRPTATRALDEPRASLWAWANTHWGCEATTGSFVVRTHGGSEANQLLNLWWAHAGESSCGQPYDQGPFVCLLATPHSRSVKVLSENSFADRPEQYVLHRCGQCSWLREMGEMLESVRLENNVSEDELVTAGRALLVGRVVVNGSEPPAGARSRGLSCVRGACFR